MHDTFDSSISLQEEKKRKLLKVRLEMARFLQETIAESGFPGSDNSHAAKEFSDFFRKVTRGMNAYQWLMLTRVHFRSV